MTLDSTARGRTRPRPQAAADEWLATPRGRLMVRRQRDQLREILPHLFGYRLLQIGDWGMPREVLESSATLCHWVLGQDASGGVDVLMDGESLPICSRCLDAVILPHSLELATSPHRLLREVDRVLCDHGHVVILGFNPYAPQLLGWRLARRGLGADMLRARKCYPLGRVRDWLALLDFDVIRMTRMGVGFPYIGADGIAADAGLSWRNLLGLASMAYVVVARKRVVPLTPLREGAKARNARPLPAGVPEPTPRLEGGRAARRAA